MHIDMHVDADMALGLKVLSRIDVCLMRRCVHAEAGIEKCLGVFL
jgi:hypothetical protein